MVWGRLKFFVVGFKTVFFLTEELTQPRSQQKRESLRSRLELKFWLRISYIVYEQGKTMIRVRGSYNKNLIISVAFLLPGFTTIPPPLTTVVSLYGAFFFATAVLVFLKIRTSWHRKTCQNRNGQGERAVDCSYRFILNNVESSA